MPDDFSGSKLDTIHYYYTIICFIIDILATSFSLDCVLPDDYSDGKSDTILCYYYTIIYFIIDILATSFSLDCVLPDDF